MQNFFISIFIGLASLFGYHAPQNFGAIPVVQVVNGGTGAVTLSSGQLLEGNGKNPIQTVATSSASCTGSVSCSAFTVVGSVSPTITSSALTTAVTSVGASTPNSTLSLGGTNPVTTTGTISFDINLAHANTWTGMQTFTNTLTTFASTTFATTTSELNVPHSNIVPTLSAGDIYVNTNSTASSSIATNDGTTQHTIFAVNTVSTTLASSTLVYMGSFGASGTTTLPVTQSLHTVTIRSFGCSTDQGTAWVAFGTGLASTTAVQCTTGGNFITPASNNVFIGRQLIKMDVGTSASSPNTITIDADVENSN
jgi:hypothetical protein